MKFVLKHEIRGRIRIHIVKNTIMSNKEADKLEYYLHSLDFVTEAKIYEKTSVSYTHLTLPTTERV